MIIERAFWSACTTTGTGLDAASFKVIADFAIDGTASGEDLAKKFSD